VYPQKSVETDARKVGVPEHHRAACLRPRGYPRRIDAARIITAAR
jgi:hypothetical protein